MSALGDKAPPQGRDSERVLFAGIEGASGGYCLSPRDHHAMLGLLSGFQPRGTPRILKASLDPLDLSQAGWGVIWPEKISGGVRRALAPLITWRRQQVGSLVRELEYETGESLFDFLENYGTGPDSVDPRKVPFYLTIVGPPSGLSFDLQAELGIARSVGRIHFESIQGYRDYAERLVAYEQGQRPGLSKVTFFGVRNQDDQLTRSAVKNLIAPLRKRVVERGSAWEAQSITGEAATKQRLKRLLCGDRAPSVLFTASHGVRFRIDTPRQTTHQGALLCSEWPGPLKWQDRPIPNDHLFSAVDLPLGADLPGIIALLFACYSAGTPRFGAFEDSKTLAATPFVSPLPRALLRRGALAVIGHVDLVLEQSYLWYNAAPQLEVFDSILFEVMAGYPVGYAMRHLSMRHAQLASHAATAARKACQGTGEDISWRDFQYWAAYEDARKYILLGDPAARLHE